jgi:hypothetical protein
MREFVMNSIAIVFMYPRYVVLIEYDDGITIDGRVVNCQGNRGCDTGMVGHSRNLSSEEQKGQETRE